MDLVAFRGELGFLNISWSHDTIEEVEVEYTIFAVNLNGFVEEAMGKTMQMYFLVPSNDNTSCDVYSFRVKAMNDAGTSDLSESITSTFPSVPDLSPIENSLQYSLSRRLNGVLLTLRFNVRFLLILCWYYLSSTKHFREYYISSLQTTLLFPLLPGFYLEIFVWGRNQPHPPSNKPHPLSL